MAEMNAEMNKTDHKFRVFDNLGETKRVCSFCWDILELLLMLGPLQPHCVWEFCISHCTCSKPQTVEK